MNETIWSVQDFILDAVLGESATLVTLSKESGIPFKTLERWYWPRGKNNLKNEVRPEVNDKICPACWIRTRKRRQRNGIWYYCGIIQKKVLSKVTKKLKYLAI